MTSAASGDGKSTDVIILELVEKIQSEMPENLFK